MELVKGTPALDGALPLADRLAAVLPKAQADKELDLIFRFASSCILPHLDSPLT